MTDPSELRAEADRIEARRREREQRERREELEAEQAARERRSRAERAVRGLDTAELRALQKPSSSGLTPGRLSSNAVEILGDAGIELSDQLIREAATAELDRQEREQQQRDDRARTDGGRGHRANATAAAVLDLPNWMLVAGGVAAYVILAGGNR